MLLSFDPLLLVLWITVICFIPGAILAFSVFRKSRYLAFEKLFIGFGLGLIILPAIPFILYMLVGIKFSYTIALFCVALFYAIAIALFVKNKVYEDFTVPKNLSFNKNIAIALIILIILFLSFWIRILPYSPIFFELDPYFYTDVAQQILTFGENPPDDQTAWYPDAVVSHRTVPVLGYMEALWYSFYNGGTSYDNLLLANIASIYPPICASLALFFLYLFVSSSYRREWGILAAGIAGFIPIFLFKTTAGEMEVQPYAFFALAFFLAMYASMIKEKRIVFAVFAGLTYGAVALGSASEIVALTIMLIFVAIQSIYLYLKENDLEELKSLIKLNAIVFVIGPLFSTGILKGFFYNGSFSFFYPLIFLVVIIFAALLFFLRKIVSERLNLDGTLTMILYVGVLTFIILAGLVAYFFTPLGVYAKGFISSAISIAQYNVPLDRTIAEQHPAGADLSGSLGFISATYPGGLDILMSIPSAIVNVMIGISITILNFFSGTNIVFTPKANNMLLFWIALFGISLIYSFFRSLKSKDTLLFLFAAAIFPPLIIGIIKAKYTIYAGFLIAAGIGFIFGEGENIIKSIVKRIEKDENTALQYSQYGFYVLALLAALIILSQFLVSAGGFAPIILSQSMKTRFQDDPASFTNKFQSICTNLAAKGISEETICTQYRNAGFAMCTMYDSSICTVASDPVSYANSGTNNQYNRKLCYYSLISDITNPKQEEMVNADFRCKRLSEYWIETMEWIKDKSPQNSRFTSWWDYGHWTNFFGQRDTVLRNEHRSKFMIGEVAHDYLDGTPVELAAFMKSRDSKYAIFDMELVGSAQSLGGKYGALNYLMCARNNQTDVSKQPGMSQCEADHLWETVIVPRDISANGCTISEMANKTGVIGYKAYWTYDKNVDLLYSPNYPYVSGYACFADALSNKNTVAVCQNFIEVKPAYCIGDVLLANSQPGIGTYLLNETYPNGDLKLNKARVIVSSSYPQTFHLGDVTSINLFYTKDPIFLENGQITDGYDDRKTKFYSSTLYQALFLDDLPGFTKVFETKDLMVKIYKLEE
jgi:hypothetical protein